MFRIYTCIIIAVFSFLLSPSQAQTYAISTFAGQGLALGDAGPAIKARFGAVSAIAMGPDGSLYVADSAYHQVRRVTPDGNVSLFAGSAVRGFGGDAGPATAAMLDTPTALAVDSGGFVYIGDSGNHRVRVVTTYGNIQTLAGNGQVAPSPAMSPVLPGEGGPATAAPLNQIAAMAFDSSGKLVIADSGNNRIFRVVNGNIKTIAGNATSPASLAPQPALAATLNVPAGLAADYLGDIFFSEQQTGLLRQIDTNGKLTTIAGNGSPLAYNFLQPGGLTADSSGNIYVAETSRVSEYIPPNYASGAAASVQLFAGDVTQKIGGTGDGGPILSAGMNPRGLAVDSQGKLYVADSSFTVDFHNRVRIISNNTIAAFAGGNLPMGAGDNGAAVAAQLYFPRASAIDAKGNVYIADTADNRVRMVGANGTINAFAGTGSAGTSGDQGPASMANLNPPTGLAVDNSGNIYIDDGSRIRQVSASGTITTFAGGGSSTQEGAPGISSLLFQSGSLAVDSQNNVYVAQRARVSRVSSVDQTMTTVAGNGTAGYSGDSGPATAAQINNVSGIALDSSGNLYIADEGNGRIRMVDSSGNITTIAGGGTSLADGVPATSATLNLPLAVTLDGAGNLFIAEYGGNRVRMVDTSGNIHTVAGDGLEGFLGDGGVSTNASINGPTDVKIDGQGNIYVADSLNSAIRKLTPINMVPTPAVASVKNAGSLAGGPLAPGERVILTGTLLGPNSKIMFDSTAAPILSSTLTSAVVVVPNEVSGEAASQVTVTIGGATSASFAVQIAPSAPGIYTQTGDGQGQAFALNEDGTINTPMNPVPAGQVLEVLCTGGGLLSPAVATGVPAPPSTPSPALAVTAMLDGNPVNVEQAYALPGTLGEFVADVRIPEAESSSTPSIQIMVGSAVTQIVSIAVQPMDSGDSGDGGDLRVVKHQTRPLPPTR